jgi:hypothetical protein
MPIPLRSTCRAADPLGDRKNAGEKRGACRQLIVLGRVSASLGCPLSGGRLTCRTAYASMGERM